MASEFTAFVEKEISQATIKAMPFFHNVEWATAVKILKKGVMEMRDCDVFNEPLIYLFYGRPAYKTANQGDNLLCPISIVLKPNCGLKVKRIFPFDSGAFEERYRTHIPSGIGSEEFQLECRDEMVRKHVELFFRTNKDYVLGNVSYDKKIDFSQCCVQAFINIIKSRGTAPFDDRVYSVEYQIVDNVNLSESILALAAPASAFDDATIRDLVINNWKAIPIEYEIYSHGDLRTYHGAMFTKIMAFLDAQGYFLNT